MGDRLKGKVAVVTGSGQGIGRAIAVEMAREGAKVITNNRRPGTEGGDAQTTADEIRAMGGEAVSVFADVSIPADAKRLVQAAIENFGKLDILVNNAGIVRDRMIWKMSDEEWDSVIKVHLYGCFYCTREAAAVMREQRSGRIINLSSRVAFGTVGQANYSAAKGGINALSQSAARDLGRYGITVNIIFPAADTRIMRTPEVLAGKEKRAKVGVQAASGAGTGVTELPDPVDVGRLCTWLSCDEAANVNGQMIFSWGREITLYSQSAKLKSMFTQAEHWTVDDIAEMFPKTLGEGLVNPAPPQPAQ